jgi:hypothetical protein
MPTRFEVFMAMKIQVEVFWAATLCSIVVRYQHFRDPEDLNLNTSSTKNPDLIGVPSDTARKIIKHQLRIQNEFQRNK